MFDEMTADKHGHPQRLAPARAFSASDLSKSTSCEISQTAPAPITLVLPYPISANRYWNSFRLGNRMMVAPSSEAKAYKRQVATLAQAAGISQPISGRVQIDIRLWPSRPQDWAKRYAQDPFTWDDTVRCLDLDNANKVLLDALKGIAIDDDRWVRRMTSERMRPDGGGARVAVRITPLVVAVRQRELL